MKFTLDFLQKIRNHLLKEKKKVDLNITSLKSQDPFSDPDRLNDNAASDADASEEISHERMQALEKELKIHKSEIEETLERIKNGRYGKCSSCAKAISPQRLGVKPTALYCVDCERKREKKK